MSFLFLVYVFYNFFGQYHAYINFCSRLLQIHCDSRFWSKNSGQMPIFDYFTKRMDSNSLHGWSFTRYEPPNTPSKVDSTKTIPLSRGWVVGTTLYLYLEQQYLGASHNIIVFRNVPRKAFGLLRRPKPSE